MSGKRGQGIQHGGFVKPSGTDDKFDEGNLKATRQVLEENNLKLKAEIRKYENQLKVTRNPEERKKIQIMIDQTKTRLKSNLDALNYYNSK